VFANILILLESAALVGLIVFLQFSNEKRIKKLELILGAATFFILSLTVLMVSSFEIAISAWVFKAILGMLIIPMTIQAYRRDPGEAQKRKSPHPPRIRPDSATGSP
jgi:hypothetical protein